MASLFTSPPERLRQLRFSLDLRLVSQQPSLEVPSGASRRGQRILSFRLPAGTPGSYLFLRDYVRPP